MNFSQHQGTRPAAKARIVGIGGAGQNIVESMVTMEFLRVECIVMNTDTRQGQLGCARRVQLGENPAARSGTQGNYQFGQECTEESREAIAGALRGAKILFLIAGLGGGTGTGAAPVVAEIAKKMGLHIIGIAITPFAFEGKKRLDASWLGIKALLGHTNRLLVLSNQRLLSGHNGVGSLGNRFDSANSTLRHFIWLLLGQAEKSAYKDIEFQAVRHALQSLGLVVSNGETVDTHQTDEGYAADVHTSRLYGEIVTCPNCGGEGSAYYSPEWLRSKTVDDRMFMTTCSVCRGSGCYRQECIIHRPPDGC